MSTELPTVLDAARVITADTEIDVAFLQGIDEQIQALGREAVEQRSRSFVVCYPKADPDGSAIQRGTVVALRASAGPEGEVLMVPATSVNVAAGAAPLGLLTETTAPGSRGRVACGGMVPASVSGLSSGANLYVRANGTTGLAERVALLSPTDIALGLANPDGAVVIQPVERASFQPFVMMKIANSGAVSLASIRGMVSTDVTVTRTGAGVVRVQLATGYPSIEYPRMTPLNNVGGFAYEVDIQDSRTLDVYTYLGGVASDTDFTLELS